MKVREFQIKVEYDHFEPGDFVTPNSNRSPLERTRVYFVTEFYPPVSTGYDGVVFVEGEQYGSNSYDVEIVPYGPAYPEDTPEWVIAVIEGRYISC